MRYDKRVLLERLKNVKPTKKQIRKAKAKKEVSDRAVKRVDRDEQERKAGVFERGRKDGKQSGAKGRAKGLVGTNKLKN